jgi:Fur family ferric uptake transcriptional regulator
MAAPRRPPAPRSARPRRSVAPAAPREAPEGHRATLASYLARKSLKWTRQREHILDLFLRSGEHLTCEEIHARVVRRDPSVGLATVYRTLRLFVEADIAAERRFNDGVTRYEPAQAHHDHMLCVRCGRIVEFENDDIERLQESIATRHGFRLMSHRHELYGSCSSCST